MACRGRCAGCKVGVCWPSVHGGGGCSERLLTMGLDSHAAGSRCCCAVQSTNHDAAVLCSCGSSFIGDVATAEGCFIRCRATHTCTAAPTWTCVRLRTTAALVRSGLISRQNMPFSPLHSLSSCVLCSFCVGLIWRCDSTPSPAPAVSTARPLGSSEVSQAANTLPGLWPSIAFRSSSPAASSLFSDMVNVVIRCLVACW